MPDEPVPTRAHEDTADPGLAQAIEAGEVIKLNVIPAAIAQAVAVAAQNVVQNQQMVNAITANSLQQLTQIGNISTGMLINKLISPDINEAVSVQKLATGDETANKLLNVLTALAGGQQATKAAQSTPPETAVSTTPGQ